MGHMNRNGLLMPQGIHGPTPPQQVTVLAQPFNDVQLVCFVAAQVYGLVTTQNRTEASVEIAQDIVAEAVFNQNRLKEKIAALAQEPAAA